MQYFDGNATIHYRVSRFVNTAHATSTNEPVKAVPAVQYGVEQLVLLVDSMALKFLVSYTLKLLTKEACAGLEPKARVFILANRRHLNQTIRIYE